MPRPAAESAEWKVTDKTDQNVATPRMVADAPLDHNRRGAAPASVVRALLWNRCGSSFSHEVYNVCRPKQHAQSRTLVSLGGTLDC